jgi:glycosyltransferase involved in cell wall biosynthesis
MHIILILPAFYPDSHGGAERQTRILAQALQSQGAGTTILAPTRVREAAGPTLENGVEVVRIYAPDFVFLGGRYLYSMLRWWWLAFLWLARNRRRYQVISIQHVRLHAAPGILAGMLFGKVLAGKLGRGGAHFDLRRLKTQKLPFGHFTAFLAKRSNLVFAANSAEIVADLRQEAIPEERIFRVPNGVDVPAQPRAAYRGADGRKLFVFAGRLQEEKGVSALLEAFAIFSRGRSDVRLDIYGGGPLKPTLEAAIARLDRADAVRLCGTHDDRDLIYGGAAFMVLPSDSEGMSNTLLEAMSYAVVPLITAVSGARDLVEDGVTGLELAGNSVDQILDGLRRADALDSEEWQAMGTAARSLMLRVFSIDVVASQYLRLFRRLLPNPPAETRRSPA